MRFDVSITAPGYAFSFFDTPMSLFQKLVIALGLQDAHETFRSPRSPDASGQSLTRSNAFQEGFVVSEGMPAPRACTLRDMTPLGRWIPLREPRRSYG